MALGGGTFTSQNKILPGSYINFISAARAAALSERGTAAMAFVLDWGVDGEVFSVTAEEFRTNAVEIFGYEYAHEKMKGIRDLFKQAQTLLGYKLNTAGVKASNTFAMAKYSGVRGNDIKVIIQENIDDSTKFDVQTLLGVDQVDFQTAATISDLVDNRFVQWDRSATLEITAATPLAGGSNGVEITVADHQNFLNKIEAYTFHALGAVAESVEVSQLYAAFTKRMREEVGVKFQSVVYNLPADYMGVVNVKNKVLDANWTAASAVYWVTGAIAGCPVNKSNLNKKYDGEFTIDTEYTQTQLIEAIKAGEFTLHRVGSDIRVLSDINSLVTVTEMTNEVFKENQTVRVIDQIGNDIASLFNTRYLGTIPNDESGRVSLWNDIVRMMEQLQGIRAIENFSDSDVEIGPGETKKSVVVNSAITVVNTMSQLYMTNIVA